MQLIFYNHKSPGGEAPSLRQHIPHSEKMTHACVCLSVCAMCADLRFTV